MKFGDLFKKKDKKDNVNADKNKKLTTDMMNVDIYRLVNNSPVQIGIFGVNIKRDRYNTTVIINEETKFKEELPGQIDSVISDILFKLESNGLSLEKQIEKVNNAIAKKQKLLNSENNGQIKKVVDGKEESVKINIQTEKNNLRLLKCVKFVLENKKGEGFFEKVDINGFRTLSYLVRDGELIPYWHKTPNSNGEPIILVPDVAQRKKFFRDAEREAIQDFNESQDTKWRGILGIIGKALRVISFLALIIWTIYLARWSSDLHDESLQPEIDKLKVENEKIRQICSSQIANQIENNGVLIDYAKNILENEQSKPPNLITDKSNIQI